MTDARFPERWLHDRRVVRLSDAAFRLFAVSLIWSVANRTDGHLQRADLTLMHSVDKSASDELVSCGLWQQDDDDWVIGQFVETQTTRREMEALDNLRKREREKKRRQRARERESADVPGTIPRYWKGQDRTGRKDRIISKEELEADSNNCSVCGEPIPAGAWFSIHPACRASQA